MHTTYTYRPSACDVTCRQWVHFAPWPNGTKERSVGFRALCETFARQRYLLRLSTGENCRVGFVSTWFLPRVSLGPANGSWALSLGNPEEGWGRNVWTLCWKNSKTWPIPSMYGIFTIRCVWFVRFSCRQIKQIVTWMVWLLMIKSKCTRPAKLLQWFQ